MKKQAFFSLSTPYTPKPWAVTACLTLNAAVSFVYMGKSHEMLKVESLLVFVPDFYSHISNFAMSFEICLLIGFFSLVYENNFNGVIFGGILLLVANFICEWFFPILENTPDKIDGYYGFAGIFLAFVFFVPFYRHGLRLNPNFESN